MAAACKEMDALYRLINGIALLDVLQSFATVVGFSLCHRNNLSQLLCLAPGGDGGLLWTSVLQAELLSPAHILEAQCVFLTYQCR